jgi:hypothetical protein
VLVVDFDEELELHHGIDDDEVDIVEVEHDIIEILQVTLMHDDDDLTMYDQVKQIHHELIIDKDLLLLLLHLQLYEH